MRFWQIKIVSGQTRAELENELNKVLVVLANRDCPVKDVKFFLEQTTLNAAIAYEEEV
jgi:hypothetical protein